MKGRQTKELSPRTTIQKGGVPMTKFEEYQEHIQYTHHAFCRIVIRHASIDAARKLYSKWIRETSLEYLSKEKFMPFAATDEYFTHPPSSEEYPFIVCL